MTQSFRDDGLLTPKDEDNLRHFSEEPSTRAFPKTASVCKQRDSRAYHRFLRQTFSPSPAPRRFRPPAYYSWFEVLGIQWILTTNFDKLLEMATGRDTVTWRDSQDAADYIQDHRPLVFHIHGVYDQTASIVHTTLDYDSFRLEGIDTFNLMSILISQNTLVVVGYSLGDPFIEWIYNKVLDTLKRGPDWYMLVPESRLNERLEWEERFGLKLLGYKLPTGRIADPDAHVTGLQQWFNDLGRSLNLAPPQHVSDWRDVWQVIDEYTDPPSDQDAVAFYEGGPSDWNLVRSGRTAKRSLTTQIFRNCYDTSFSVSLIAGAAGEGKTTVLRQIGMEFLRRGERVFEARTPHADFRACLNRCEGDLVVLVDDADQCRSLFDSLEALRHHRYRVRIVMAARTLQWRASQTDARLRVEEYKIGKLSDSEAAQIALLLSSSGAIKSETNIKRITDRLVRQSGRFLLAAMWEATRGKALREILADAVRKIGEQPGRDRLLFTLAVVASIEGRVNRAADPLMCTFGFFCQCMGVTRHSALRLLDRLEDEVRPNAEYGCIQSRHPSISVLLRGILFRGRTQLSEFDVLRKIVATGAAHLRNEETRWEGELFWQVPRNWIHVPNFLEEPQQVEMYRELYKFAVRIYPDAYEIWPDYVRMLCAIGDRDTACDVCEKGLEYHPESADLQQLLSDF